MTPKKFLHSNGDEYLLEYNNKKYTFTNLTQAYSYNIENFIDVNNYIREHVIDGEKILNEIMFDIDLNDILL